MIKPEQIPPEVVEAAVKAFDQSKEDAYVTHAHDIRVAITAALAAWPGNDIVGYGPPFYGIDLILPLTQQDSDE